MISEDLRSSGILFDGELRRKRYGQTQCVDDGEEQRLIFSGDNEFGQRTKVWKFNPRKCLKWHCSSIMHKAVASLHSIMKWSGATISYSHLLMHRGNNKTKV